MQRQLRRETAEFLSFILAEVLRDFMRPAPDSTGKSSAYVAAKNVENSGLISGRTSAPGKALTSEVGADAAMSVEQIEAAIERPKKLEHGHLAWPLFPLAKILRRPPPALAAQFAALIQDLIAAGDPKCQKLGLAQAVAVGGFLNLTICDEAFQDRLIRAVRASLRNDPLASTLGNSDVGKGRRLVIDYSSPNVAKPMHVGHLRATVIGQAIRNLAQSQGYEVIGLNHLGDWGVQFGKLAWAYRQWGHEYDFEGKAFPSLFAIYVRFHEEAEKRPELEALGSAEFKKLEDGDPELQAIWKRFVQISLEEYQKVWDLLGVQHDLVRGESFYNDRLQAVESMLEQKKLLVLSDGAFVVPLGDDMPPCLIRKSDGASLYATRDLASAIYRREELKADLNLYVVGFEQSLHFKQVFKVLQLCGYDWVEGCHHVAFGLYRFKEGVKMSTRKGQVIFLEEVLRQAIERTREIIQTKNPNLSEDERARVAEEVGVGAVIFNDLLFDRSKNVEFDWDRILSFEGDSGPYVQYMHVRCASLIKKFEAAGLRPNLEEVSVLSSAEERELIRQLMSFDEVLESSFAGFRPNVLAQYLLEVCAAFSRFYHEHRILDEAEPIRGSRMALVECTRVILARGLRLLSIRPPQVM
jgi:arginyl-tRNA synthetase